MSIDFDVKVRISGFDLVLLAVFGGGRSVSEMLEGKSEWGPLAQPLEPFLLGDGSQTSLLDGMAELGKQVDTSDTKGEWVNNQDNEWT